MKLNISFSGLLTVAFIVLKLLGKITWSWLWVLSPLWIPLALWLVGIIIWIAIEVIRKWGQGRRWRSRNMRRWNKGDKVLYDIFHLTAGVLLAISGVNFAWLALTEADSIWNWFKGNLIASVLIALSIACFMRI